MSELLRGNIQHTTPPTPEQKHAAAVTLAELAIGLGAEEELGTMLAMVGVGGDCE